MEYPAATRVVARLGWW